jgi:hypothetical protein
VYAPENGLLERGRQQFLLHKPSDVRQIQERFTAGANRWWQETAKELNFQVPGTCVNQLSNLVTVLF